MNKELNNLERILRSESLEEAVAIATPCWEEVQEACVKQGRSPTDQAAIVVAMLAFLTKGYRAGYDDAMDGQDNRVPEWAKKLEGQ